MKKLNEIQLFNKLEIELLQKIAILISKDIFKNKQSLYEEKLLHKYLQVSIHSLTIINNIIEMPKEINAFQFIEFLAHPNSLISCAVFYFLVNQHIFDTLFFSNQVQIISFLLDIIFGFLIAKHDLFFENIKIELMKSSLQNNFNPNNLIDVERILDKI